MGLKLLVVLIVLALVVFLIRRRRDRPAEQVPDSTMRIERLHQIAVESTPYHAVSIDPCDAACSAARELEGKRFLSGEAPSLPLPDCTHASCDCHFLHHKDRRSNRERRSPLPRGSGNIDDTGQMRRERRSTPDRRKPTDDNG